MTAPAILASAAEILRPPRRIPVAVALERWATHTGKQPQRHEAHD